MVIGILLLFGIVTIPGSDPSMVKIMGLIFLLWGLYRIVTYRSKLIQMKRDEEL